MAENRPNLTTLKQHISRVFKKLAPLRDFVIRKWDKKHVFIDHIFVV